MAIKKTLCILLLIFSVHTSVQAHTWQKIAPGLFYAATTEARIFRIDPKKFKISIAMAKDVGKQNATVKELAQKTNAWLAINGGFFSPSARTLGLLARNGKMLNPLHPTSWWGIFYIEKQIPHIVPPKEFTFSSNIDMALQVGPRLVVNGETLKFKPALARRSGIGIRPDGTIMIAIIPMTEISMEDFARFFQSPEKNGGLGCKDALNLDGGSSSQLYFSAKDLDLNIPGIKWVTNAITVSPR